MLATLGVLSLGIHAAAVQTMDTEPSMDNVSHQMSPSICFSACTTATVRKDKILKEIDRDNNDEPKLPFYVQSQASSLLALKETHDQEARAAIEKEPPPETTPAYISLGVFRA